MRLGTARYRGQRSPGLRSQDALRDGQADSGLRPRRVRSRAGVPVRGGDARAGRPRALRAGAGRSRTKGPRATRMENRERGSTSRTERPMPPPREHALSRARAPGGGGADRRGARTARAATTSGLVSIWRTTEHRWKRNRPTQCASPTAHASRGSMQAGLAHRSVYRSRVPSTPVDACRRRPCSMAMQTRPVDGQSATRLT